MASFGPYSLPNSMKSVLKYLHPHSRTQVRKTDRIYASASGWVMSRPLSRSVIGKPGPGASARSAPIARRWNPSSGVASGSVNRTSESRRSTYLTDPGGASAFADALARLGIAVEHYRRPPETLAAPDTSRARALVALLGPTEALDAAGARHLLGLPVDLLLAGSGSATAIRS